MNAAPHRPLFYAPAPQGSPDRYVTVLPVTLYWRGVPARFMRLAAAFTAPAGGRLLTCAAASRISLLLPAGFHFDVSVAPSCRRAMPAAAAHDWLYANADALAAAWGCRVGQVLELADHWFLALMRGEAFAFSRSYFLGVSLFGYLYNRVSRWLAEARKPFSDNPENAGRTYRPARQTTKDTHHD